MLRLTCMLMLGMQGGDAERTSPGMLHCRWLSWSCSIAGAGPTGASTTAAAATSHTAWPFVLASTG